MIANRRRGLVRGGTILCLGGLVLLGGCSRRVARGGEERTGRPVVVTSIYPLSDWVRQVAGPAVEVHCLLPPGASPHTYEPTPELAEQAARASLLVVTGLGLDGWAERLALAPQARTLRLGETVATLPMAPESEKLGHEQHGPARGADPHVWLDPVRAAQMVATLTRALVEVAPSAAVQIRTRGVAYQHELEALGRELEVAGRELQGRPVITMHGGFQYLLARCGLPPAQVITPFAGQEPSARYLEELGRWARVEGVRVIFAESQLAPRAAEMLAREIGGQVLTLDPLGTAEDPVRSVYVSLVRWDLQQLRRGLREEATAVGRPARTEGEP